MAFYSGKDGQLLIAGSKAAKVQSWSYSSSQAVLETTSLEDTDRTIVPGVRSYSGSARLFYYQTANNTTGDVTTLLRKSIKAVTSTNAGEEGKAADADAPFALKLNIYDDGTNNRSITFNIYVTGVSMNSAVGEVLSADISWEANGAPTEVTM